MRSKLSFLLLCFFSLVVNSQTTIKGTVKDNTGPIPGVNISIDGKSIGTATDFDGNFTLETNTKPPFNLVFSSIGYKSQTIIIEKVNQNLEILLEENQNALDEIVVSASRNPERIMESPVSVERMDIRAIKNTSSPTFYDGLENLKGVDVNTNSLTFKSVNTRGFATFSNERFVQLVDGMDNSSPALNFVLGNLLGMSELDVNTVELLPGASSALYGANAFNGILFMTSKNPFDHEGVSFYGKSGITSQEAAGDNNYVDVGLRVAKKFSDKFAGKASISFLNGTDWYATDYGGVGNASLTRENPAYDGVNTYGDEVSTNINGVAQSLAAMGVIDPSLVSLVPSETVSRTGYRERDLMDYKAESVKVDFALHYRPFENDFEIIYNGKIGRGNTIYQGSNRYYLKDFFMQQHKIEFKNNNFFVRAYTTAEKAGNSYDTKFAAINMNSKWKDNNTWFGEYVGGYLAALAQGADNTTAHSTGRSIADIGRLEPGTPEFEAALNGVVNDPDLITGAKFQDNTKLYHADANYNFGHLTDFADIQVGGSWRRYSLNSSGTIFTDYDGAIDYDEYGIYTQIQKKFMEDRLKLTASIRYDKSQNFDGNISPRASVVYSAGDKKQHNFRASFQTGFRNPTTQNQYIGLDAGRAILIGTAPDNLDRYTSKPLNIQNPTAQTLFGNTTTLTGRNAFENSFTLNSLIAYGGAVAQQTSDLVAAGIPIDQAQGLAAFAQGGVLEQAQIENVKPEQIKAFEIGYRGILFDKITIDASGYYNIYQDFIASKLVATPLYGDTRTFNTSAFDVNDPSTLANVDQNTQLMVAGIGAGDYQVFDVASNSSADVTSYGATIGLNTTVGNGFKIGASYTYSAFDFDEASDPDFRPLFNTPESKIKLSLGNENLFKNFGFNINYRYADEYLWQSSFADGMLPSTNVFDGQINYRMPKIKSTFKVGGSNIGGEEYRSAIGSGSIGSIYYLSWTINP